VSAALAGLTTRGRSFLAAGAATSTTAVVLGQRDLLRVGVLLLALPLVAVAVLSRARYRLACGRRLDPPRIPVGAEATVRLRLENLSRLPTGVLLVEDDVPFVLGSPPRFVLDQVEPRGVREVSYRVRADVRGRHRVGPLRVHLADPFGLVELTRSFTAVDPLVVTPAVTALPAVRLGGDWSGGGDSRARSVAAAGEDDVATREYRQGDDLRRVHWRSTARYGELMVRREEQPWQNRGALLLDARRGAHRADGGVRAPGSTFEVAVSAAASIGVHLARHGFALRLVTDSGASVAGVGGVSEIGGGAFEELLLDALAVVEPSRGRSLVPAVCALRHGGGAGLVVAVLGAVDPGEAEGLARLRHGSTECVALLLDTASWARLPPHAETEAARQHRDAAALLRGAGWRVVELRAGQRLAERWPYAAERPVRTLSFEGPVPGAAEDPVARSGP
jgi:uncharacterized protein (DUF58 family)